MSLYRRGEIYWAKLYRDGRATYESLKTTDKIEAKRLIEIKAGYLVQ
jgi:hypothetical protein